MFNIAVKRTFTHDVPVLVPIDGGFEEQTLKTTFNYLDTEEVKQFDLKTPDGTSDCLLAVVHSLHELVDNDKNAVPYNEAVRDQLFRRQYVRQGLLTYYFDAVSKAKAGN
jgi:hypothetical protein